MYSAFRDLLRSVYSLSAVSRALTGIQRLRGFLAAHTKSGVLRFRGTLNR